MLVLVVITGLALVSATPVSDKAGFLAKGTKSITTSIFQTGHTNSSNFVFSPLGYSTLLAVLAEGAVGPTRNQIAALLHFPDDAYTIRNAYKALLEPLQEKDTPYRPQFKNWFYAKDNIKVEDGYKAVLEENYFTEVKHVEDTLSGPDTNKSSSEPEATTAKEPPLGEIEGTRAVEQEIIQSLTDNKINEKLKNNEMTEVRSKVIAFNALFFNGEWKDNFTEIENGCTFETLSGPVTTKCIQSTGDYEAGKLPLLEADFVQIPYQGDRYSLVIIVPENNQTLDNVIKKLPSLDLSIFNKQVANRTLKICLPKFKFYTISRPKQAFNQEGVEDVYSATMADLSTITGTKQLYLADLVQFVAIEVNEKSGSYNYLTATGISSLREAIPEFHINKPFLFFLRDKIDNYILVAGKLENPNEEQD